MTISISSRGGLAVGDEQAAPRAASIVNASRSCNVVIDNYRQFTAECLTANFGNAINFMWMLRDRARGVVRYSECRA